MMCNLHRMCVCVCTLCVCVCVCVFTGVNGAVKESMLLKRSHSHKSRWWRAAHLYREMQGLKIDI